MNSTIFLGGEDQPLEHQFGTPAFIRTDSEGNVYVADKANLTIKVFDRNAGFLRSIGGRGRAPGEFSDIMFMEFRDDSSIVVSDPMNQRYTILSREGSNDQSFDIDLDPVNNPHVIKHISWTSNNAIVLQPRFEPAPSITPSDPLFYVYSHDLQDIESSFGSFRELFEFNDLFAIHQIVSNPGSFVVSETENEMCLVYSPGIYTGTLYNYCTQDDNQWVLRDELTGRDPWNEESYQTFSSVQSSDMPPVRINYRGEQLIGRVMSMDAGVFQLQDERIVHFIAEWKEGENTLLDIGYLLDVSVQVFDTSGDLQYESYLFSLEGGSNDQIVNWKDHDDNFYIRYPGETSIRQFSLNLPE